MSFDKLSEMSSYPGIDPFVRELAVTEPTEFGRVSWRPRRQDPQPALLELLYARLPARFPALFESLLLTYRWAEVDLQTYSLMANPPGPDLEGFFRQISGDRGLWEALLPAGYLRFGKGAGGDYDPVCFDMNSRTKSREMRIVKIDHEVFSLPTLSTSVVDTIGCGDAYFALSSVAACLGAAPRLVALAGSIGAAAMTQRRCNERPITEQEFMTIAKIVI